MDPVLFWELSRIAEKHAKMIKHNANNDSKHRYALTQVGLEKNLERDYYEIIANSKIYPSYLDEVRSLCRCNWGTHTMLNTTYCAVQIEQRPDVLSYSHRERV